MDTDKLAVDEARRIAQHGRVKGQLEHAVQTRIEQEAARASSTEQAELGSVAAGLKHKAAAELLETQADLERARGLARALQLVDYAFFLVYSLVGLEIGLELLGARQSSGFKQFLDAVTRPLLGPFRGLMPDPSLGSLQLMLSYVVAALVYALLHQAVRRLLRLLADRRTTL